MPKFRLEKIVRASRQKIFDVCKDYESYQRLFPAIFPSVRILSTRNDVSVVEEHMVLGSKELIMMTKHLLTEPTLHEVFVIGGDAKGTHIIEKFEETNNGTRFLIDVDFKLKGSMIFSNLFGKSKIEDDYSKIIDEFVRIVEF